MSANIHSSHTRRSAPSPRFLLDNKGEAYDQTTHLTWLRCSVGTHWKEGAGCVGTPILMSLPDARVFAQQAGEGWRIPTVEELYSLVEPQGDSLAINSVVFPDVVTTDEGAPYWSATQVEDTPMLFYYVDFVDGRADGHSEGFSLALRLVRSQGQ